MKYFRMSYDEVVSGHSYINLILLNRAIPGYKPSDEKEEEIETLDDVMPEESEDSARKMNNFLFSQM